MKDIDFDELDRAVNSLIGDADTHALPEPTEPVIDIPSTGPMIAPAPAEATPITVTPSLPVVEPTPAVQPALAARRSGGRFMDVVHPSSNMRTTTPAVAVTPVARTVAPVAPIVPAPAVAVAPVEPVAPVATQWPDPIDFQTPAPTPVAPIINTPPEVPAAVEPADVTATPLESPFIPDAKVEKRPLGAFSLSVTSTTEPASEPVVETPTDLQPVDVMAAPVPTDQPVVTDAASDTHTDGTDEREEHPIETDVPLPAELQNDLLSVESDEVTAAPVATSDTLAVPASITQQYTETPSTGDQPEGHVFDTSAYKKPLAHPKKKKSGWLMVLWIFLLVVVGAGAGAAVYIYILPQL